jgi:ATP-dependent 26S proteasome regulatory subunit
MNDSWLHAQVARATCRLEVECRIARGDADAAVQAARDRLAAAEARLRGGADALPSAGLELTRAETRILWTLVAIAIEPDARAFVRCFGSDDPTTAVLGHIAGVDAYTAFSALAATATLRRLALVERSDGGGPELHESRWTWAVARRVLAFLHGDMTIDPGLAHVAAVVAATTPIHEVAATEAAIAGIREGMKAGRVVVCVSGSPGAGRRTMLAAVAREADIDVIQVDAKRLARAPTLLAEQLAMIARECKLLARVPLIADVDAVSDLELVGSILVRELDGIVMVTCGVQRPTLRWGRPVIAIELGPLTSAQRVSLWQAQLGQGTVDDAELLATRYPLAPAMIHRAAAAARARAVGRRIVPEDIYSAIRTVLDDRLGEHARRVTVTQSWNDVVLPDDQLGAIAGLIARVRQRRRVYEEWGFAAKVGRGLGTTALFSGPPGTGKTMVAALIAKDLGLELYQVDLAKLVSKYIGETEKHLAALFDAAEAGHAILLFDEADSLFGKRTDVKTSNDRYANLETNYLLQRLESFTGICLLTTNHEANIDPAFQRRLSLHVRFELPHAGERAKLWRAMLPETAPRAADIDFTGLARRFEMSGGYIRNAALRAAFLAADEGSAITHAHLEYAAELEYESMGKITFRIAGGM